MLVNNGTPFLNLPNANNITLLALALYSKFLAASKEIP